MSPEDIEFERQRRARLIYGDNDMKRIQEKQLEVAISLRQVSNMESEHDQNTSCADRFIISKNSAKNAVFEIIILLLVAYSCFTTMFYITFDST